MNWNKKWKTIFISILKIFFVVLWIEKDWMERVKKCLMKLDFTKRIPIIIETKEFKKIKNDKHNTKS